MHNSTSERALEANADQPLLTVVVWRWPGPWRLPTLGLKLKESPCQSEEERQKGAGELQPEPSRVEVRADPEEYKANTGNYRPEQEEAGSRTDKDVHFSPLTPGFHRRICGFVDADLSRRASSLKSLCCLTSAPRYAPEAVHGDGHRSTAKCTPRRCVLDRRHDTRIEGALAAIGLGAEFR